jgi:hypothetical protein
MAGHKHAALMAEYAKDAARSADVHKLWQYRKYPESAWTQVPSYHPAWDDDYEYRRKPQPVELWVNVYSIGFATHASEESALDAAKHDPQGPIRAAVHMREVTE